MGDFLKDMLAYSIELLNIDNFFIKFCGIALGGLGVMAVLSWLIAPLNLWRIANDLHRLIKLREGEIVAKAEIKSKMDEVKASVKRR